MASEADITPEIIRQTIDYNPETGLLVWKQRPLHLFKTKRAASVWNARFPGRTAFNGTTVKGHKRGPVFGREMSAHRVAWAIATGNWPEGQIDHINGNPADNRLCNLRDVSCAENVKNKKLQKNNTSGKLGVYFDKAKQKWIACIGVDGGLIYLGGFSAFADAVKARDLAESKYGFHKNHGRT